MNKIPPLRLTILSEILFAKYFPPATASPVHTQWPKNPPRNTKNGLLSAARAIVETYDLSPHSPRNVKINACQITTLNPILSNGEVFSPALLFTPVSISLGTTTIATSVLVGPALVAVI